MGSANCGNESRWNGRPAGDGYPDVLTGTAWQNVDEAHPTGTGRSCYRVVFKTLRVAVQSIQMSWPNLIVRLGAGQVESGGFFVRGALPTRVPQNSVLPEFGKWQGHDDDSITYEPVSRVDPDLRAWQEATPPLFYVEILLDTVSDEPTEITQEGRRRTSGIVTMLELTLGRRLVGPLLTEEAGERFDDGHFNRHIGTELFAWEAQLDVTGISQDCILDWSQRVVTPWMAESEERRAQVSLACEWYQSALSSPDLVLAYLQYWFAAEVLAMGGGTNVAVLRDRLIDQTVDDEMFWRDVIGRLYGRRGGLVHGTETAVEEEHVDTVRCLIEYLLADTWRCDCDERLEALRAAGRRLLDRISGNA